MAQLGRGTGRYIRGWDRSRAQKGIKDSYKVGTRDSSMRTASRANGAQFLTKLNLNSTLQEPRGEVFQSSSQPYLGS